MWIRRTQLIIAILQLILAGVTGLVIIKYIPSGDGLLASIVAASVILGLASTSFIRSK